MRHGKIAVNQNTHNIITKAHTHTPLKVVDFGFRTKRKDKFIMPVFRVKKVKDYTIMPNLHLRNRQLSLRAKGLLCQMQCLYRMKDIKKNLPDLCFCLL